ncbi:MAG: hypothetical protein WBD20_03325 [Pirellulaceae bacterium]
MAAIPLGAAWEQASQEARDAMDHFLGNTGADRALDVRQILLDSPSARQHWDDTIVELVNLIHGKRFVGTIQLVDKAAHLGGTNGVWVAAVGQYTGWSTATITGSHVNGVFSYDLEFTYNMWDPYDWDPTKLGTPQPSLAKLHLAGMAQQYMTEGSHSVTLSWSEHDTPPNPGP